MILSPRAGDLLPDMQIQCSWAKATRCSQNKQLLPDILIRHTVASCKAAAEAALFTPGHNVMAGTKQKVHPATADADTHV